MLSLVAFANRTRGWFPAPNPAVSPLHLEKT